MTTLRDGRGGDQCLLCLGQNCPFRNLAGLAANWGRVDGPADNHRLADCIAFGDYITQEAVGLVPH